MSQKVSSRSDYLTVLLGPGFFVLLAFYSLSTNNKDSNPSVQFTTESRMKNEKPEARFRETRCSEPGYEWESRVNLAPKRCGILEIDRVLSSSQSYILKEMGDNLITKIGVYGYDLHDSVNLKYIKLHEMFANKEYRKHMSGKEFELLYNASSLAKSLVSANFGIPNENLHFSKISQFTRHRPVSYFTEARHIDKVRSDPLLITSIFWLTTAHSDFTGGATEFVRTNGNILVEPKMGGFAAWSSSYENPHALKDVTKGCRITLIFGFTVDPNHGFKTLNEMIHYK